VGIYVLTSCVYLTKIKGASYIKEIKSW